MWQRNLQLAYTVFDQRTATGIRLPSARAETLTLKGPDGTSHEGLRLAVGRHGRLRHSSSRSGQEKSFSRQLAGGSLCWGLSDFPNLRTVKKCPSPDPHVREVLFGQVLPAWAARRLDLSLIGGNLSLFKGLKMFRESGGGVQGALSLKEVVLRAKQEVLRVSSFVCLVLSRQWGNGSLG